MDDIKLTAEKKSATHIEGNCCSKAKACDLKVFWAQDDRLILQIHYICCKLIQISKSTLEGKKIQPTSR